MKNHILAAALVAAVVGALSAALTSALVGPAPVERGAAVGRTIDDERIESQLASLGELNRELADRLAALENRPVPPPAARVPVLDEVEPALEELATLQEEVRELATSLHRGSAEELPVGFVQSVGQALEQIREVEAREREQERQETRAAQLEERLARLTETLGLSGYQVDEMRVILTDQEDRRAGLFLAARESGDRGSVWEGMRALRDETNEALARVLTDEQMATYQQQRDSRGRFGRPDRQNRGGRPGRN